MTKIAVSTMESLLILIAVLPLKSGYFTSLTIKKPTPIMQTTNTN